MTMTAERLAELDAVMAKATAGEWEIYGEPEVGLPPSLFSCETTTWPSRTPLEPLCRDDESAIVALHNAYPDLRAHIEAQAATIARLREALQVIVDDYQTSPKHHPNDILIPIASFGLACAALTGAAS